MFTDLLETTAELMTWRQQRQMTSFFLLLTFGLHQIVGFVDVSRQNSVVVDDGNNDNNNNNNTG